jgi:hypothetical protein
MRKVLILGVITGGAYLALTGCDLLGSGGQASAPPVVVTNNIVPPSGSEGLMILTVVLVTAAFGLLAWAMNERRHRAAAEDAVIALTGRPISHLRLVMAAPTSTERLQAMAVSAQAEPHRELH